MGLLATPCDDKPPKLNAFRLPWGYNFHPEGYSRVMGWPGGHLCLLVQVPVPYEPRINRIMKETPEKRVVGCWDLGGILQNGWTFWNGSLVTFFHPGSWRKTTRFDDMKNWINFGVIHAMTSITPGGQHWSLISSRDVFDADRRMEKVTPKNIFSLKWWVFEMVDFHLPLNHGISANKSPFEKKQQQQKHIQVMSWMTLSPKKLQWNFPPPKMKGN